MHDDLLAMLHALTSAERAHQLAELARPAPTAEQLHEAGYVLYRVYSGNVKYAPSRRTSYSPIAFPPGVPIGLLLGPLPDETFLCCLDLDQHTVAQDADAAVWEVLRSAVDDGYVSKLVVFRSTGGDGYHVFFKAPRSLPNNQRIYIGATHVGEIFSTGGYIPLTGPCLWGDLLHLDTLSEDELDALQAVVVYQRGSRSVTSWTARAREVLPLVAGYETVRTKGLRMPDGMPRIFVGTKLPHTIAQAAWRRLKEVRPGWRSDAYANYVQSLAYLANGTFGPTLANKCRVIMALAVEDCPKRGEKGYKVEKDTAALIGRILHGDPYQGRPGFFRIPGWAHAYRPIVRPRTDAVGTAQQSSAHSASSWRTT